MPREISYTADDALIFSLTEDEMKQFGGPLNQRVRRQPNLVVKMGTCRHVRLAVTVVLVPRDYLIAYLVVK
eukprot:COSAG02_NODE_1725_length_11184_cov_171.211728_8_plen_71_part_00